MIRISNYLKWVLSPVSFITSAWDKPKSKPSKKTYGTTNWKEILKGNTNGKKECARRLKQMGAKNGLI